MVFKKAEQLQEKNFRSIVYSLFPTLQLPRPGIFSIISVFKLIPFAAMYWRNIDNRRNFFIEFAAHMGFDPLVPENWDKLSHKEVVAPGRGTFIGSYYSSVSQALMDVFPNIGQVRNKKLTSMLISQIPVNSFYQKIFGKVLITEENFLLNWQ